MKTINRLCAFCVVLALVLTILPFTASAAAPSTTVYELNVEEVQTSENFIPITREEYIQNKAEAEGITCAEAEAELEQAMCAYESTLVSPYIWESDTSVPKEGGITWVYGRIYQIYTHVSGFKILYSTQAVLARHHYGSNWIECSNSHVYPYGSGEFQFDGNCYSSMISNTQIRLVAEGNFLVEQGYAITNGLSDLFTSTETKSGIIYYRDYIYTTHVETAKQST